MNNHTTQVVKFGEFDYLIKCVCGWRSERHKTVDLCDEDVFAHFQNVERARTSLRTKTPSLETQRNYYLDQSEDMRNPPGERLLWRQLALELSDRLNDDAADDGTQEVLF